MAVLIGAYGHDDRVCGYAALKALLDIENAGENGGVRAGGQREIGSMGITGMQSAAFDTFMQDLCESQGVALRVCYENAFCLSADVTAAYDPNFAEVYEKRNAAYINGGVGICKYTGARGKSGSSDANAETVGCAAGAGQGRRALADLRAGQGGRRRRRHGGPVYGQSEHRHAGRRRAGAEYACALLRWWLLDCYEMYRASKALYQSR